MSGTVSLQRLALRKRKMVGSPAAYIALLDNRSPLLARAISAQFKVAAKSAARQALGEYRAPAQKCDLRRVLAKSANDNSDEARRISASIDLSEFDAIVGIITDDTEDIFRAAYADGMAVAGVSTTDITEQANQAAVDYAKVRGAELVGKRVVDGEIVDNPNSKWHITTATRDSIQRTVYDALNGGYSAKQLADSIESAHAFSDTRAMIIARTEVAFANNNGNVAGWKDSGEVEGKQSILGSEHDADEDCDSAAEQGVIGIDEDFDNGYSAPPYHPNCVCAVVPVLKPARG